MTYALDLVRRLSKRLLAVDLIDDELDLPHDGLRLIEVNASLDRRLLLCLCRCIWCICDEAPASLIPDVPELAPAGVFCEEEVEAPSPALAMFPVFYIDVLFLLSLAKSL
jgi:hypothetical protein